MLGCDDSPKTVRKKNYSVFNSSSGKFVETELDLKADDDQPRISDLRGPKGFLHNYGLLCINNNRTVLLVDSSRLGLAPRPEVSRFDNNILDKL